MIQIDLNPGLFVCCPWALVVFEDDVLDVLALLVNAQHVSRKHP